MTNAQRVLAIDPGTKQSGYCYFDCDAMRPIESGVLDNEQLRIKLAHWKTTGRGDFSDDCCAIEMIQSHGMAVGREVFETCVWIGRFVECWPGCVLPVLIYRSTVKLHLCGSVRARDSNIWQALIDKVGPPGLKKTPGPTYGVKSHARQALAVAVTFSETEHVFKPRWSEVR